MVEITYHGKPLTTGPQCLFKLCCGVRPSFGFFRAPQATVDYVLVDQSGDAGDLVFTDGINTVTLPNIYLVKSVSVSALNSQLCDIVLADERILWQYTYGTQDYNTYNTDRTERRDIDEDEYGTYPTEDESGFALANQKNGGEWTFAELVNDIRTALGLAAGKLILSSEFAAITRRPRNIIGRNIAVPCILQQVLLDLGAFLAAEVEAGGYKYTIYPTGAVEIAADLALLEEYSNRVHESQEVQINPKVSRGATAKMFAAADPEQHTEGRSETFGSEVVTGGTGVHIVPSPYAIFADDQNETFLDGVGAEVAGEYKDSFQNTWRDQIFTGPLPFVLNRAIHEIVWYLHRAAMTRVRAFRTRVEMPEELKDTLFSYSKYLLGGGGTGAIWAKVIRGLQYADPEGEPPEGFSTYSVRLLTSTYDAWSATETYSKNALVLYQDYLYKAKADIPSSGPPPSGEATDTGFWAYQEEIVPDGIAMENDYLSLDLRNWPRWFCKNDIIPLVKRSGDYYIWQTVTPAGKTASMSLRWNETDNRLMAVYK